MHDEQEQVRPEDPYPGGPILILIMSKIDGHRLVDVDEPGHRKPLVLSRDEMQSIRQQCLDFMEYVLLLFSMFFFLLVANLLSF
jgi:hypothetical protein